MIILERLHVDIIILLLIKSAVYKTTYTSIKAPLKYLLLLFLPKKKITCINAKRKFLV